MATQATTTKPFVAFINNNETKQIFETEPPENWSYNSTFYDLQEFDTFAELEAYCSTNGITITEQSLSFLPQEEEA